MPNILWHCPPHIWTLLYNSTFASSLSQHPTHNYCFFFVEDYTQKTNQVLKVCDARIIKKNLFFFTINLSSFFNYKDLSILLF